MTKIFTKTLTLFLLFFVFVSSQSSFSQCFQIESILAAACSPAPNTEGYNEMARFKVGNAAINTSGLTVSFPAQTWQGLVQNATTAAKVDDLNAAIDLAGGCGNLLEPVGGVLPANATVILVTSYLMNTSSNPFGALSEDTYIIFQNNASTTAGHFTNYGTTGTIMRTFSMNFGGGCSDSVTYNKTLLIDQNGVNVDAPGATILFTASGTPTYVNYGCSAPVPPFTVDAGTSPISACAGSTIALSGTAVGQQSVSWTAPDGTFSSSTTLATNYTIPTNAAGQTITITLTATNSCGASIADTIILTVVEGVNPAFSLPTVLCNGAEAPALPTISDNGITGTWSPAVISNTTNGFYVFTPTNDQCATHMVLDVTVQNAIAPVTDFAYTTPNCIGDPSIMPTLAPGFTTGGTFTSNANLSLNALTGEINIAASTSGFHSILYTVAADPANCIEAGSGFFTIQITNSGTPIVEFSYPSPVCMNSGSVMPILASGFVTGGTFTSDTGLSINPSTGEIDIAASTTNPHSIIYTLPANPAACQGAGTDFFTIQITNSIVPVTDFSYPTTICATSSPVAPTPGAGFAAGGTYTSDAGLSINATTGVIDVAASTTGTHTITYTIAADLPNCNQGGSSTFETTINPSITPVTDFSYTTPVCANNPVLNPILGAGFSTGGTYTSDAGLSINATTGAINVVSSAPGSYTITYTVSPDPTTCNSGGSATFTITIDPAISPIVGFSYPTPVCSDSAPLNPVPVTGFTTGGTYASTAGLSIDALTGIIDVATSTPGSYTVTYTIDPDPATCNIGGSDTAMVVINAVFAPVTTFSYATPLCANSPVINPIPVAGFTSGGAYTSDAGLSIDPTTGAINVTASTTGSHTITYTVDSDPATCNTGGSSTFAITINPTITPITDFSYTTPVCSDNIPLNPIPAAGFITGGIFTSTAGLSINATTGIVDVVGSTPGSYTITYTVNPDTATCNVGGSSTAHLVINAIFTPVTGFTYATPICPDSTPVNPNTAAGFSMGGVFTSDAGLNINPTTGQINVTASTVGTHIITYTIAPNAATCNLGNSTSFTISIDAASAIAPITGSTFVCVGETIQLSNATPGGTWSSSDESIATVDSNGLVTGVASNYVDIIYSVDNTCTTSVISNITVYANPNPLLEDKYLCVNNTTGEPYNAVLLECGIPNANFTFVWTLDGNPLPSTTNSHLATELGVYEVTVTNTVSGCVNTTNCTVSASSTAVATAIVGEDFNQNQTITVLVTGGSGNYLFQLDHGVPQESNVFTYARQGEYTITIIDKNGCQDLELTVFALNYPRFFTPNGDGFNDTWGIKGLTDLKAKAYIYDRFGKLVKYLNASGEEWDGTLNGHELPSTDYWFLLEYKNREGFDKEFKAHFSLKR